MEVGKINSVSNISPALRNARTSIPIHQNVAFKAGPSGGTSNMSKKFWLLLRQLGSAMKDITETKNAVIAAIGTGIIAPAIILVSPGKGDEEDKNKKFIQALRQPLSAVLALGFQLPATSFINRKIDKLEYEKKINFFKDEHLGDLIPTQKYLAKNVLEEEITKLETDFDKIINGKSLKQELEAIIKEDYEEVGLKISNEDLAKQVNKKKKNFLREKIAEEKFKKIKAEKLQELLNDTEKYSKLHKDFKTDKYKKSALDKYSAEYSKLEKDANLSFFDKLLRTFKINTKKTKQLAEAQNKLIEEKSLELLKEDCPKIFTDNTERLKKYIDICQKKANKTFEGKKFWISLLVNLFMVTASCFALNWLHPRVNKLIENKKAEKNANNNQKVEVK